MKRVALRKKIRSKSTPIKTTMMELIQELSRLTKDDSLVVAAVKNIFARYNVRLGQSFMPVRLVGAEIPTGANPSFALNKRRLRRG